MVIENGSYTVYAHINKINGKIYIGITGRPVEKRWKNGEGYKTSSYFYKIIQKYGWDSFDHEIIASNLTEEEACNMEYLLIQNLELQNKNFGYNIKDGGNHCELTEETKKKIGNALRGRTYSEEKKRMYSEVHKGKKLSTEHIDAIKNSRSKIVRTEEWNKHIRESWMKYHGENHPNYGKKLSKEHLKKMHEAGREFKKAHPELWASTYKKVLCIETNVEYESIEQAAQKLNIARSSISECASGKRKSAGGYHWKFV